MYGHESHLPARVRLYDSEELRCRFGNTEDHEDRKLRQVVRPLDRPPRTRPGTQVVDFAETAADSGHGYSDGATALHPASPPT